MLYSKFNPQDVIKFCPKCWSSNFCFDWKKRFDCEKCNFVRYNNPVCWVMPIIKNDRWQILVTIRGNDPWKWELDLPWWFVDIWETIEDALKREVKEELNLNVINMKFFGSFPNEYIYKWMIYFPLDFIFECEVENFDTITFKDDISGYDFIDPISINLNDITSKSFPNVIREYIQRNDY